MNHNDEDKVGLVATDFHGTLYGGVHPEIILGKYAVQEMVKEGNVKNSIKSFFEDGLKGFLKFRKREGSTRLLENLGCILEGQDPQIVEDFKENYDSSNVLNQLLNSVHGADKNKEYYSEPMELFPKISEEVETIVYSQSLEELINFNLSKNGYTEYFTEGVVGNRLKTEDGKIVGIDWRVDGPNIRKEEQKMDLLDIISSKGYDPQETAYIDNERVGILKRLEKEGGEGIVAPTASEQTKKWGVKNDIYVPDEWSDVGEYLGV